LDSGSGKQWDAAFVEIFAALLDQGLQERVTDRQLAARA
jgi:hypothetical protein